MESVGIWLFYLGTLLTFVGWIWLLLAAFSEKWYWGLGLLFFPPSALAFVPLRWRSAARPFGVLATGAVVTLAAFGVGWYAAAQLGPHKHYVDGELHLTLTGWNRNDYSLIATAPETVVLQMANPDVTDETLAHLSSLQGLRELDLNNTQVTDAALPVLAKFPKLASLRLSNTKVTDAGFREHLLPLTGLRELDLRGTEVTRATVSEWRKAQMGRKALR